MDPYELSILKKSFYLTVKLVEHLEENTERNSIGESCGL